MMKVVIAGTNGLAQHIANFIATTTSHQFVILSRRANAGLTAHGWQVLVCDYNNPHELQFKIAGADTLISTIGGMAQLALIEAAAEARVRRFIPSEFAGAPSLRPIHDPLDHGRRAALSRLEQLEASGMKFTYFVCGIFYEHFAPGGLSSSQLLLGSEMGAEGTYIIDFRNCRAEIPYRSIDGTPVYISMTSASDVARAVVAALDLPTWPREYRLRGEQITIDELVVISEQVRGQMFERSMYTLDSLQDALTYARAVRQTTRETQLQHLVATAEGHYDFDDPNWDPAIHFQPESFSEWLLRVWNTPT